mgnify:CR=1 FL=1
MKENGNRLLDKKKDLLISFLYNMNFIRKLANLLYDEIADGGLHF